jgi:CRISPR-associated endonuclease Cas2
MEFLIAYDITDPRRLTRVATYLERCACRTQKSVFLFHGSRQALDAILPGLLGLVDPASDRVQVWSLHDSSSARRIDIGTASPTNVLCAIVGRNQTLLVEDLR